MSLKNYEQTIHLCKLVQRLQKQEDSPKCIAHIIYKPLLLTGWCNAEYKQGVYDYYDCNLTSSVSSLSRGR